MGQRYWLYRETSEEARGVGCTTVWSVCTFSGELCSPLFLGHLQRIWIWLPLRQNAWAPVKNDLWTTTALKEKSGSFPRFCLVFVFPPSLNATKASVLETTHMNMNNIFWPLKCSILHQRADIIKIFARAISLTQRTLFSALQITQCNAWLLLVIDGCRFWSVRIL